MNASGIPPVPVENRASAAVRAAAPDAVGTPAHARSTVASGPAVRVVVDPRRVLVGGTAVVVVLTVANLVSRLAAGSTEPEDLSGVLFHLVPLTSLDAEGGIAAWYSAVLLATCAGALWTVAHDVDAAGRPWHRYWQALAAGFLYLSVDEAALLHERIGQRVRMALELEGSLYFSWVVVGIPAVVVVAVVFLRFLRALPRRTGLAFVVSGALYVGGAVGLEMIGAALVDASGYATVPYIAVSTLEEVLELAGATLFLVAVGEHHRRYVAPHPGRD